MDKVYNEILKEVCAYYGVRRYDVLMTRDTLRNGVYNKARCVSIYFMKQLTGNIFKSINIFFDMRPGCSYAGTKHNSVVIQYMSDDKYKIEIDELQKILEAKINLEVSL